MSELEQRIAIAEACGWKMFCQEAIDGNWTTKDKWITAPDGTSRLRHDIPDYLHDLNAMHEVEKTITKFMVYEGNLERVCKSRIIWNATAPQRAEAFLRTIGKWSTA